MNESLTVGDGNDGTITFDGSKTLTVEDTSLVNQDLTTDASPTFAGATITGTIIAQEFKTEFVSASILFRSGSNKLGDTADDVQEMTGSLRVSGSSVGEHYIIGNNVGIGTINPDSELHVVAAGSPSIRVTDTTNTVTGKFQTDNSLGKIGTHTNHPFQLFSNNTTALTIDTSQKVGIALKVLTKNYIYIPHQQIVQIY